MKTVHIVAMGGGWNLSPKEGEIWTVNKSCLYRNGNLIFYMDRGLYKDTDFNDPKSIELFQKRTNSTVENIENIEKFVMRVAIEEKTPVMTTRHFDDIPNCIVFPLEEIVEKYGCDCFGNSVDYMVAYALYKGYNDIHTYGVNMGPDSRSEYEKAPLFFWLGMAMGLGCRISVHGALSRVLSTDTGELYGYDRKQWIERDKGMQRKF